MSLSIRFEQMLDYSDHERAKWRHWIAADPARLTIPVQPGRRFPNVGAMLDHIYFVERRHLSRLQGGTPPDASGIPEGDWHRLFDYADLVRADLRRYVADIDDHVGSEVLSFRGMDGNQYSMTRRRLLMHVAVHEIRHLAQLALAARLAGVEPPGDHDLFMYKDFV